MENKSVKTPLTITEKLRTLLKEEDFIELTGIGKKVLQNKRSKGELIQGVDFYKHGNTFLYEPATIQKMFNIPLN